MTILTGEDGAPSLRLLVLYHSCRHCCLDLAPRPFFLLFGFPMVRQPLGCELDFFFFFNTLIVLALERIGEVKFFFVFLQQKRVQGV